jgi:(p)ppGpp synthase/HD superfamily hydrolase
MMNMLEEAIVYATIMHQGKVRKLGGSPYILHPIEVAQILSTITDDQEVITAGILHDIVEDTDGTLAEIEKRFGQRVAKLVDSESEEKYPGEDKRATWKRRKEESIRRLMNSDDIGVRQLWLADKLSNMRSLNRLHESEGEAMWNHFHQKDPAMHEWYYREIAELTKDLGHHVAWKEYVWLIDQVFGGVEQ